MRVTLKYPTPRGVRANTEFYGFYVKTKGETRALLDQAHTKLMAEYGSPVSNSVILRDALRLLVGSHEDRKRGGKAS